MWQGINQRRFPRAQYQCVVSIRQEGKETALSTVTENIGLGGVCVLLERGLDVFSPAELSITLKDGKPPLQVRGTVVWVVRRRGLAGSKFDTGIEFVEVTPPDRARLEAVIDKASWK